MVRIKSFANIFDKTQFFLSQLQENSRGGEYYNYLDVAKEGKRINVYIMRVDSRGRFKCHYCR